MVPPPPGPGCRHRDAVRSGCSTGTRCPLEAAFSDAVGGRDEWVDDPDSTSTGTSRCTSWAARAAGRAAGVPRGPVRRADRPGPPAVACPHPRGRRVRRDHGPLPPRDRRRHGPGPGADRDDRRRAREGAATRTSPRTGCTRRRPRRARGGARPSGTPDASASAPCRPPPRSATLPLAAGVKVTGGAGKLLEMLDLDRPGSMVAKVADQGLGVADTLDKLAGRAAAGRRRVRRDGHRQARRLGPAHDLAAVKRAARSRGRDGQRPDAGRCGRRASAATSRAVASSSRTS